MKLPVPPYLLGFNIGYTDIVCNVPLWTSPVKLNVIVFPDIEQLGEHTKVPLTKPDIYWWGNTTSN